MNAPAAAPIEERSLQVARRQLAPALAEAGLEQHPEWPLLSRMPMQLSVGLPLPRFRVKDLLALKAGQVIESVWASTAGVPLRVGQVQLSWTEFEVVEQRLAVRITRLA